MDFQALAAQRYSLRKYSDRPVEDEKLQLILQAAQSAPTAHNLQPQRIFVLRSAQALEKADACMDSHFHPPVILAVTYDAQCAWTREGDGKNHGEIDAALCAMQMMLQAAELGLGTTYVGMFSPEKLLASFPEMAGCTPIALPRVPTPRACTPSESPSKTSSNTCKKTAAHTSGSLFYRLSKSLTEFAARKLRIK